MRPSEMGDAIARNLEARTGRSKEQWLEVIRRDGPPTRRERLAWLKAEHGLGASTAMNLAWWSDEEAMAAAAATSDDDLIAAQYAGAKAGLRPIFEAVVATVRSFGPDVTTEARTSYVSFQRGRQFGLVAPSSRTRVDVALRLPGVAAGGRLEEAAGFGTGGMTHRVRVTSVDEVDEELAGWLRSAYGARG